MSGVLPVWSGTCAYTSVYALLASCTLETPFTSPIYWTNLLYTNLPYESPPGSAPVISDGKSTITSWLSSMFTVTLSILTLIGPCQVDPAP